MSMIKRAAAAATIVGALATATALPAPAQAVEWDYCGAGETQDCTPLPEDRDTVIGIVSLLQDSNEVLRTIVDTGIEDRRRLGAQVNDQAAKITGQTTTIGLLTARVALQEQRLAEAASTETRLRAVIARKNARIVKLRAIIRDLRED